LFFTGLLEPVLNHPKNNFLQIYIHVNLKKSLLDNFKSFKTQFKQAFISAIVVISVLYFLW